MAIFKCKMCGGDLEIYEGSTVSDVTGNSALTGYEYRINKALLVRPAISIKIE